MTIFLLQQMKEYKETLSNNRQYEQWKMREIERDLQFCHPQWPEERRFVSSEVYRIKSDSSSFLGDPWNIFEWCTYAGLLLLMSTRGAAILHGDPLADAIHHRSCAVVLIFVWLRLMKYCRSFHSLGPFITMLGHVVQTTFKFAFLFFEIFIPYCCAFWILFGEKPGTEFMYFNDLVYQVFMMTLVANYKFDELTKQDKVMAQILVGSYLAIASVVCLNLYIALMSDTFARVWSAATANAFMSQASAMLAAEPLLNDKNADRVRNVLLTSCSPQVRNQMVVIHIFLVIWWSEKTL